MPCDYDCQLFKWTSWPMIKWKLSELQPTTSAFPEMDKMNLRQNEMSCVVRKHLQCSRWMLLRHLLMNIRLYRFPCWWVESRSPVDENEFYFYMIREERRKEGTTDSRVHRSHRRILLENITRDTYQEIEIEIASHAKQSAPATARTRYLDSADCWPRCMKNVRSQV